MVLRSLFYQYFATYAFLREKVYSIRCISSLGTYLFLTLCAPYTLYTLFLLSFTNSASTVLEA